MQFTFSSINGQRKLKTLQNGTGWIEKLLPEYQVLHCSVPTVEFWHTITRDVDLHIGTNLLLTNGKLGLVKTLIQERLSGTFVLPKIFGNSGIQVGMSRITAEILCGIGRKDISGLVVTQDPAVVNSMFEQCENIASTDAFEQQFALSGIDYDMIWGKDDLRQVRFYNTVLQHSVYAQCKETDHYFRVKDENRLKFLSRYFDADQKICLTICCEQSIKNLIEFDPSRYNVAFEFKTKEWQYSYGMLLSMFKVQNRPPALALNLWVFNIQQPLNLDHLMAWTDSEHGVYYTKNRKVVVFDPTMPPDIEELANFVK